MPLSLNLEAKFKSHLFRRTSFIGEFLNQGVGNLEPGVERKPSYVAVICSLIVPVVLRVWRAVFGFWKVDF